MIDILASIFVISLIIFLLSFAATTIILIIEDIATSKLEKNPRKSNNDFSRYKLLRKKLDNILKLVEYTQHLCALLLIFDLLFALIIGFFYILPI